MDSNALIEGALTVGVGAVAGGLTNAVAVWMLFHPHEPVRVGPFLMQGAIPKNKARLARSVGKTVGERLLTAEDLTQRLSAPEIRTAFDQAVRQGVEQLLRRDFGSLRATLGHEASSAVERELPGLAGRAAARLAGHVASPEFGQTVAVLLGDLTARLGSRPVGALLTEERRSSMHARVAAWAETLPASEELGRALEAVARGELERLAADPRPLTDRLPPAIAAALEQGITDSLPGIVERIGDALERPESRALVLRIIRQGIDQAIRGMVLHQRLLARLVVTDGALASLLDGFASQGADRLAAELRSGTLRDQVRQSAAEAVQIALRAPISQRLERIGPEGRGRLAVNLTELLLAALRSEGARAAVTHGVDRLLDEADRRTWGELIAHLPPEAVHRAVGEALSASDGQEWVRQTLLAGGRALLDRPIGRPADWLGDEAVGTIAQVTSDAAWRWVMDQVPMVVSRLQVQEMVEQKVMGFSTQRMEEIVRGVTHRELELIVRLGYWLGGLVGLVAYGLGRLLG
ncbi:MAG: DUF445 family protein [Gemmatimonadota bacterium]|nr:DUF445 family protein [Gemmatimonadota bacterium]MDH5282983.1 DUF445 family protein [Gemmatimonadota bacterium]